jgi:hypothetical protein
LDIYAFGLLLYTVFGNGTHFFEAIDGETGGRASSY